MPRSWELEPKTRSTRVPVHFTLAGGAVAGFEEAVGRSCGPLRSHVEQVDEEIVRQGFGAIGEHAVLRFAEVGVESAEAADEDGHFWRGELEQLRAIDEQFFGGAMLALAEIVAEAVGSGLEHGEGMRVGLILRRVGASGREWNFYRVAAFFRGFFDGGVAGHHDEIGERNFFLAALRSC